MIADIFRLDKLRDLNIKSHDSHAKYLARVFCESEGSAEHVQLYQAIEALYYHFGSHNKHLRDVFEPTIVGLLIASSRRHLRNDLIEHVLDMYPKFAPALARGLLKGLGATTPPEKEKWPRDWSGNSCKKHSKHARTMDIFTWIRQGVFRWQCEGCVPMSSPQALQDAKLSVEISAQGRLVTQM